MKTTYKSEYGAKGFSGGVTDPRTGGEMTYRSLRYRNAQVVLAASRDIIDSPKIITVTWSDARGERQRNLIAVTSLSVGKILLWPMHDHDATTPQTKSEIAAILKRLPDLGFQAILPLVESAVAGVIANADEQLAASRDRPSSDVIVVARRIVRAVGGATTIGALGKAGLARCTTLSLVHHRHLSADRTRRFSPTTIITL